jgi:hypothetical protein
MSLTRRQFLARLPAVVAVPYLPLPTPMSAPVFDWKTYPASPIEIGAINTATYTWWRNQSVGLDATLKAACQTIDDDLFRALYADCQRP